MRVLVTGGSGFIGREVRKQLEAAGHMCVASSRQIRDGFVAVPDRGPETNWDDALAGVDAVVHLAGRVHVRSKTSLDSLAAFRDANVGATSSLAESACRAGISRVIFLSTVGVVGSACADVVNEQTPTGPVNDYALSKLEGERALVGICEDADTTAVVLRVPLVYGPAAPGSLTELAGLIRRGIPLPVGAADNQRSVISVFNLASAIVAALVSSESTHQPLYVEDGTIWSSREMVEHVASAIDRSPRVLDIPPSWAIAGLRMLRKNELANRLFRSLVVDGSRFETRFGWSPLVTPAEAISRGVV